MPAETILVVPRARLFGGAWPQGFLAAENAREALHGLELHAQALDRAHAEADPSHKQPIPYCLVTSGFERVLCVRRRQAGSEARLHGLLSLGLGGHAHPEDLGPDGRFLTRTLARELGEELHIPAGLASGARWLGLINDDATPVGQVHVGVAYWLDVGSAWPSVRVREHSKLVGGFEHLVDSAEVWQDSGRFESWSWILLEAWRLLRQRAEQGGSGPRIPTTDREVSDVD